MAFLLIALPFSKKGALPAQAPAPPTITPDEAAALRKQVLDLRLQLEVQHTILERYQKFIEDSEAKSAAELRELVRPLDSVVTELKMQVQDQFHPYLYEQHFLQAVQKALDTLFAYRHVALPVSFWMGFSDMARLKAADDIDRAILLCSLLRSLGSETTRVLIGKNKSAWVSFVFLDKQYIVDIAKRIMSAYPSGDDALKQFIYQIQYAFNDREYEDLSES